MKYNFTYRIEILGKDYEVQEISFFDFRNFVKCNVDPDVKYTAGHLNKLLDSILVNPNQHINILHKFLILIKARSLILGENLPFEVNDNQIVYPVSHIFDILNRSYDMIDYEVDGVVYTFDLPTTLYPETELFAKVCDCLYSINGNIITPEMKKDIIDSLPGLPVANIHDTIQHHFDKIKYNLNNIDFILSPLDASFITFLKTIFMCDLKGMYDLEYMLRRNLNINSADFCTLSYPECNIMLRNFNEEMEQAEKKMNPVESTG